MNAPEILVHAINPSGMPASLAEDILTADEKKRAAGFRFEKDAVHWKACRAALRIYLAQVTGLPPQLVPLILSTYGKPLLAPPCDSVHFNLSHCTDLALLAISHHGPVGIDLEQNTRAHDLLECETSFCHPREIALLPEDMVDRATELLKIWTAKEAVLKAFGTGLSHPPESIFIHEDRAISDIPLKGLDQFMIQPIIPLDGYCAAIAYQIQPIGIRFMFSGLPISPDITD